MKILIADDNAFNRKLLEMLVADCGYAYSCAENGEIAIEQIEHDEDIYLILMDVNMPVMDGIEATRQIKLRFPDRFIYIVFVTALDDEETLAKCLAIGGDDFIPKPISRDVLAAKLHAHFRTIQIYCELKDSNQSLAYHRRMVEREHKIIENIFNRCTSRMEQHCDNIKYYMSPMSQFNGDMFLVDRSPLGGVYILLGDFTGHGLAAAIGCLPVAEIFFTMTRKKAGVGRIAREVNSKLQEILPDNMFFCAALLELDSTGDRLAVWSGGMNDILLFNKQQKMSGKVEAQHMPLGILENSEFDEKIRIVTPFSGFTAYVCTDGVVEAKNADEELFGEDRLINVLMSESANKIDALTDELQRFAGDTDQSDDIGMVEIVGAPVTFGGQTSEEGDSNTKTEVKREILPWDLKLQLTSRELRNPTVIQQVLRMVCSVEQVEQHESILFALLAELFNNALEHGLLKLSSNMKDEPDGFIKYYALREERLASLTEGEINLKFKLSSDNKKMYITITDSGDGFDTNAITLSEEDNDTSHARGVNLVSSLCEEMHYSDNGRTVNVIYNL